MLLNSTAEKTIRAVLLPIVWVMTGTWSRDTVNSTIFDEHGLDPQQRYYALVSMTYSFGSGIALGTSIMGSVSVETDDFGLACQIAMPFWVFFLGSYIAFSFRVTEASHELKFWRKLKRHDLLDEFEPGYHTRASMPRAVDLIVPALLTVILSPIAIAVIEIYS